jgi:exodeoxyribonuclease III
MGAMKIATFNINNINKRLANLLSWLDAAKPDVVCLQELKATDREFPQAALAKAGYSAVWRGQKSWNGVAILARGIEPIVTRTLLPGDMSGDLPGDLPGGLGDEQARYIEAAVSGVLIASLYAPNGNPQPGRKFTYKLAWMDRLIAHAADLFAADVPVVLAGDFNVVPADGDIYPTKSYDRDALLQPESRARYARLLGQGWHDGIRTLNPDRPMYSYWSYLRNRWPRDAGLRIDHLLLSKPAAKRLVAAGVDRDVRDKDNASDHAPVWIELRDVIGQRENLRSSPRRRGPKLDSRLRGNEPKTSVTSPSPSSAMVRTSKKARINGPLLVIDGDSFAHRAYHALPKSIRRKGDKPAGAILGFANLLLRLYREERPRTVLVGWDTYEEPTYRHEAFAAYQSGREFDDEVIEQLAVIPEFVAACGFANAKRAGYEADDFLAAAVAAEERRGGRALVASGDRDTFQLASDKTTILYPIRGGGMERIGPPEVRARYGVDPKQVPDFIALRGDPSDKLPGAPGVGAGGAAALLQKYGSLTAILKAGRFPKQAEELRLYRAIATMNRKAPVPRLPDQTPTWAKAAALARAWQLKQLAERLDELANAPARNARR